MADWMTVPKGLLENARWRLALNEAALKDKGMQKELMNRCERDIVYFVNTFVWQFNPKKKRTKRVGPFVTWDFQERALLDTPQDGGRKGILWCYENDRTCVIEKSREMGASWLFLIFQAWLGLFSEYVQMLNISRSAEAVDSKSPNSLFWKLRFIHKHLPDWMKGGRGGIVEQNMYIEYKRTSSYTTGEASTGKAGVGGRAGVIFIDEFPQIGDAVEVRERTASTSDCRFFNGTHLGTDTEFYRLTRTPEIARLMMHWTEHPEKRKGLYRYDQAGGVVEVLDKGYAYPEGFEFVMNAKPAGGPHPGKRSPWYDWKCVDIGTDRGVAMELDIDPMGSVEQFFDAVMIRQLISTYCCDPVWEGKVLRHPDGKPAELIPMERGSLRLWIGLMPDGTAPKARWVGGVDTATGTGATPSCFTIANGETGEKVAELTQAHLSPDQFAEEVVALCKLFVDEIGTPVYIAWETAGPGTSFGKKVIELGYRHVYMRMSETKLGAAPTQVFGWYSGVAEKRDLLTEYAAALRGRHFLNRSREAMEECLLFKYDAKGVVIHSGEAVKNNPSGARSNHGDHVIADALAWKMMRGMYGGRVKKVEEAVPVGSMAWRQLLHKPVKSGWD